ncbi:glycosyltransferase [Corynebacterium sp. HMSC067D03]|uniref:glycosyltransferase n=1 Tax=Corynebacterium sp. HMSC067D03 TaxID=1739289 RepID=UPI000B1A7171|nr:glycosyltransferase [Corynebacterium sp. HMSC067D03]
MLFNEGSSQRSQPGVSVIVPSYKSVSTIRKTLDSLRAQTLPRELLEVVVIVNGPEDGTLDLLRDYERENTGFNLRFLQSALAGAGAARNLGLSACTREYVTFVDADDWVLPRFLESAYKIASDKVIALTPIHNYSPNSGLDDLNPLNRKISAIAGTEVASTGISWAFGFNACKLVHRNLIGEYRYNETLESGEDLVFFAQLLSDADLRVSAVEFDDNAYVRRLTENSVSRQPATFDFSVRQRLDCYVALNEIEGNSPAVRQLQKGQLGFIRRYLKENPQDEQALEDLVDERSVSNFPWSDVQTGQASDLVFSYCFPPFSDTSAVVAAKVIRSRKKKVDVVSADMSSTRERDESLDHVVGRWVVQHKEIEAPVTFNDWSLLTTFALKAFAVADSLTQKRIGPYESVYSRAMWAGSHVAAALYKLAHPAVPWIAEFSDPLRFDVEGKKRKAPLIENDLSSELLEVVSSVVPLADVETAFDLIEFLTVILADEVIFTNENQKSYMLHSYPESLKKLVEQKSLVRSHPAPDSSLFTNKSDSSAFPPERINIAYFGSFYSNRGLRDVLVALMNSRPEVRSSVVLHIFTNQIENVESEISTYGLTGTVRVKGYLPYLDFLSACVQADVLLVNDAVCSNPEGINPFLPSKFSDYKASGTSIWGVVQEGSPLSELELTYQSGVGNAPEAITVLDRIFSDFT